ncbi:glycosyltransferase [Planktothrix pseudagardhii]|uniref:D-inositol 3-phosphate glycosyltransferase n=1 Tax=Planktothrix pseudagardhii TaxID=132604 RepID=A0A9W4GBR4_9CYAN|nr:glycosyltransferase [Planktothrix pseudagardhii]CAD5984743.1 D-inositol 3-phosphate glycosyltransferase [Planktothrix pseudagardhii]
MTFQPRTPVALISIHGDPDITIGQEEAGGQNVYVRQVGEALAALGWPVDMFTRRSHPDQPLIVQHRPNCRTIRLIAGPEEFIPRDQGFPYLLEFVEKFQKYQAETGIQYELIHTNYWLSGWVGLELKKHQLLRQVHTYHSLGIVKYQAVSDIPKIAHTRLNVDKICLETAERIVATSPQEQQFLRELVSEIGNINIIPCGTNIDQLGQVSKADAREKLGFDPQGKLVFYIGRFDPRKGIETLIRAIANSKFRYDPQLKLIIGGGSRPGCSDGLERHRLEKIVDELGLNDITQFTGRILDEELPLYYRAADVCVVPSHYEPFGLVAIESMASYTPVVASNVGGLKFTVIPEVTGLLCPPKDEMAFTEAIDRILSNPNWSKQLGEAGRKEVETQFSWQGVALKLSDLYTQILSEPAQLLRIKHKF